MPENPPSGTTTTHVAHKVLIQQQLGMLSGGTQVPIPSVKLASLDNGMNVKRAINTLVPLAPATEGFNYQLQSFLSVPSQIVMLFVRVASQEPDVATRDPPEGNNEACATATTT